jgi:aminoglycoside phosphotransferase (APT) family kinase protein
MLSTTPNLLTEPGDWLLPLLDDLATFPADGEQGGWHIVRIMGGHNNIVYRALGEHGDYAAKFTRRDGRDRAGREDTALRLLHEQRLDIAPSPIWFDRDRYAQPVVVQTWLPGPVCNAPPPDDAGWMRLLAHYATLHTIVPGATALPVLPAALTFTTAATCHVRTRASLARIAPEQTTDRLRTMAEQLDRLDLPSWPEPALTFCRVDPNTPNFVRRVGPWASVDWENSGWGDPAFEIADLLAHPAYLGVSDARKTWAITTYAALRADKTFILRARTYYVLLLADWAAYFARASGQPAAGRDPARLVPRPDEWHAGIAERARIYLDLALAALA